MMRFKIGPPWPSPVFAPGTDWHEFRLPQGWRLQLLAFLLGLAVTVLTALGWFFGTDFFWTPVFPFQLNSKPAWTYVVAFLALVIIHESLHALTHPDRGCSRRTTFGIWPRVLAFYTIYEGDCGRGLLLVRLLTPWVVISALPLAAGIWFEHTHYLLVFASVINGMNSSADFLLAMLLLRQTPRGSVLRGNGHATYWRGPQTGPRAAA